MGGRAVSALREAVPVAVPAVNGTGTGTGEEEG